MEQTIRMRAMVGEAPTTARGTGGDKRLGLPFILLLVYLVIEYGRPADPLKIPVVISVALFVSWLLQPDKRWPPQLVCFFLLRISGLSLV